MNAILFHILHASLKIPNKYWKICIKDKKDYYKLKECIDDYYKRISTL